MSNNLIITTIKNKEINKNKYYQIIIKKQLRKCIQHVYMI